MPFPRKTSEHSLPKRTQFPTSFRSLRKQLEAPKRPRGPGTPGAARPQLPGHRAASQGLTAHSQRGRSTPSRGSEHGAGANPTCTSHFPPRSRSISLDYVSCRFHSPTVHISLRLRLSRFCSAKEGLSPLLQEGLTLPGDMQGLGGGHHKQ